jgi:hypothetical protein
MISKAEELINQIINSETSGPKVSIYLPMEVKGEEVNKNHLTFKNALKEAKKELEEKNLKFSELENQFAKLESKVDDSDFWNNQEHGLALFINHEGYELQKINIEFKEIVFAGHEYYTVPLFKGMTGEDLFILDFSRQHTRLLQVNEFGFSEVEVKDMPDSIEVIEQYRETEKSVQWRSLNKRMGGSIFHGHEADSEKQKEDQVFALYLDKIDDALGNHFKQKPGLILSATKKDIAIFKQVTQNTDPIDMDLVGNYEQLNNIQLYEKCKDHIENFYQSQNSVVLDRIDDLKTTGKGSIDLDEIFSKALTGEIDKLFIADDEMIYGEIDHENGSITEKYHEPQPGKSMDEILNYISLQTFVNGGTVTIVTKEDIPEDTIIAAKFRFTN